LPSTREKRRGSFCRSRVIIALSYSPVAASSLALTLAAAAHINLTSGKSRVLDKAPFGCVPARIQPHVENKVTLLCRIWNGLDLIHEYCIMLADSLGRGDGLVYCPTGQPTPYSADLSNIRVEGYFQPHRVFSYPGHRRRRCDTKGVTFACCACRQEKTFFVSLFSTFMALFFHDSRL
jgi:hypothetical protein